MSSIVPSLGRSRKGMYPFYGRVFGTTLHAVLVTFHLLVKVIKNVVQIVKNFSLRQNQLVHFDKIFIER